MTSLVEMRKELIEARQWTDHIFSMMTPEALYDRPIPERHRVIFYLGHLEAFDWNQLCRWSLGKSSFHDSFDTLFEAGIDPEEGTLPQDQPSDWPSIAEVQQYGKRVRQEVDNVLAEAPESVIQMAIEHRWMHAETTAYILHHLSSDKKRPSYLSEPRVCPSPDFRLVEIPAGRVTLGRDPQEGFGWDNEFFRHHVDVPAFAISQYKVTNGQYRKFVDEGGSPPPFWVKHGNTWWLNTMFGERPLPEDWPVYASLRLARQYAEWEGLDLPTEAQFHRAAYGTPTGVEQSFPWGNEPGNGVHGNFHFADLDPVPVTAFPAGNSPFGVSQLVGNGWEWTSTQFAPFEGFQAYPTYQGYSARFFDDDHFVVKGASATTARRLLRRSFRNWFRLGYPHAHAGFRCVKNF